MKVGDIFESYDEFSKCLEKYKKKTFNQYYIRDAKTIETQRKRFPNTVSEINEDLKYYYVVLSCIKGGRKFVSKNENSLRTCGTYKQDCPATLHLNVTICKQYLTITKHNKSHNHTSSRKYFESLSHQRLKLPSTLKEDVIEALKTGANKKFIRDKLQATTGCKITLKDLGNLKRCRDKKSLADRIYMREKIHSKAFPEVQVKEQKQTKRLTNHEKFKLMDEQGKIMAKLCSKVSTPIFFQRLSALKKITEDWCNGYDIDTKNQKYNQLLDSKTNKKAVYTEQNTESMFKARQLSKTPKDVMEQTIQLNELKMPTIISGELDEFEVEYLEEFEDIIEVDYLQEGEDIIEEEYLVKCEDTISIH